MGGEQGVDGKKEWSVAVGSVGRRKQSVWCKECQLVPRRPFLSPPSCFRSQGLVGTVVVQRRLGGVAGLGGGSAGKAASGLLWGAGPRVAVVLWWSGRRRRGVQKEGQEGDTKRVPRLSDIIPPFKRAGDSKMRNDHQIFLIIGHHSSQRPSFPDSAGHPSSAALPRLPFPPSLPLLHDPQSLAGPCGLGSWCLQNGHSQSIGSRHP
ncbi:hypothetical protein E2C01_038321 [Portunus trituberculatus]|uniref:Uncharacterized protein n=1 Tax=Portunus trituberculatus TaxID=210409 RepID=A0A5B7FJP1_PORTR|nr:hypothetical protein [Portunus trituberculatus]